MSKPFTAPATGDYERPKPIPAGLAAARCYSLVDLGLQKSSYMGEEKIVHKLQIAFELPQYRMSWTDQDGNEHEGPRVIGTRLTCSMGTKANLRKYIESWFGKKFPSDVEASAFDLRKLVGKPCMINVVHNESNGVTYANIGSISPPMAGMDMPAPEMEPLIYTGDETEVLDKLPRWLREVVASQLVPEKIDPLRPVSGVQHEQEQRSENPAPPAHVAPQVPSEQSQIENAFDDDIPF